MLLNERYQILTVLGKGGFGSVYKARDVFFQGRLVAVKQISLKGLPSQEFMEATSSFNREVQLLSELQHASLPCIYDYFIYDEHCYFVMGFIDGETLEQYLAQSIGGHFLHPIEVLKIAIQLCNVLDYMHTHQPPIIFRDLKPSNVILSPKGRVYLIDFGIARLFKPGQAKDTMIFGSPGYAAPEQYGRAQTTPVADIYSLGALMHQMLTGADPVEVPFRFASIYTYKVNYPQASPLQLLDRLIMQMLEMDPDNRPGSMALVKQQLEYIVEQYQD